MKRRSKNHIVEYFYRAYFLALSTNGVLVFKMPGRRRTFRRKATEEEQHILVPSLSDDKKELPDPIELIGRLASELQSKPVERKTLHNRRFQCSLPSTTRRRAAKSAQ